MGFGPTSHVSQVTFPPKVYSFPMDGRRDWVNWEFLGGGEKGALCTSVVIHIVSFGLFLLLKEL